MAWFLISNFSGRRNKAKHYLICDLQSTELAMQGQPQRLFAVNLRCCSARVELPSEKTGAAVAGPCMSLSQSWKRAHVHQHSPSVQHRDKVTQGQNDTGTKWHRNKVTQPVCTDGAAEPVATLRMQKGAVQLSVVLKNGTRRLNSGVMMTWSLVSARLWGL